MICQLVIYFYPQRYLKSLLYIGKNFSLPVTNLVKLKLEFIKNIENNLKILPIKTQIAIRNASTHIIIKLPFYSSSNCDLKSNF